MLQASLRDKVFRYCTKYYQDPSQTQKNNNQVLFMSSFTVPEQVFNSTLSNLELASLYNSENWTFKKEEDLLEINGLFSYDMDLFFDVKDLR